MSAVLSLAHSLPTPARLISQPLPFLRSTTIIESGYEYANSDFTEVVSLDVGSQNIMIATTPEGNVVHGLDGFMNLGARADETVSVDLRNCVKTTHSNN